VKDLWVHLVSCKKDEAKEVLLERTGAARMTEALVSWGDKRVRETDEEGESDRNRRRRGLQPHETWLA
jgi:hypothetical protein